MRAHRSMPLLGVAALVTVAAATSAPTSALPPGPATRLDIAAQHALGDTFACVAAPTTGHADPPFGLVLARRGDARRRAVDRAQAERLIDRLELTGQVRISWTSPRLRWSSMHRIELRLAEGFAPYGLRPSRPDAPDTAHCTPWTLTLMETGEPPAKEAWAAQQVARYGADRVQIKRVPVGTGRRT